MTGTVTGISAELSAKANDRYYNGKEAQDVVGWYDFGARMYNPEIGRWMTVDPSAEEGDQESFTPYGYVFNNPVKLTDPDGRVPVLGNIVAGVVGAGVELGIQMASNVVAGKRATENIDWRGVAIAGAESALTMGASTGRTLAIKAGIALGKNILDKVENNGGIHNASDVGKVVKGTVTDMVVDKVVGKSSSLSGKVIDFKALEKFGNKISNVSVNKLEKFSLSRVKGQIDAGRMARNQAIELKHGAKELGTSIKQASEKTSEIVQKGLLDNPVKEYKKN